MKLDISELTERFPRYEVAGLVLRGASVPTGRPASLEARIAEAEAKAVELYGETQLSDIPELKDWREAYKGFGIKSTSYRSSVERLLRSALKGRGLPRINGLVDAYNLISLEYLAPVGADDIAKLSGDIAFRYARSGDSFIALGDAEQKEDPPKDGEVVYADDAHVLCRRWNWYQDARSPVTLHSRDVVLTVQGQGAAKVEEAARALCGLLTDVCGGEADYVIANAHESTVTLP